MGNRFVGKTIKAAREKKGYTQDELADKLNVTKQAVSNWERGRNRVDEDTRIRLSEILNFNINLLNYSDPERGDKKMIKDIREINSTSEIETIIKRDCF